MLSPAAIAQVAYAAGVTSRGDLATAVAIALAESGGNEKARNPRPPDNSYGLWQINMLGALGPARRQQYNLARNEDLYNPATNARVMFGISGGGKNWAPWSTYNGLRYKAFLPAATLAAAGIAGAEATADAADAATGGVLGAAQEATGTVIKAGAWMSDRNNWMRVAKVVAGLALATGAALTIAGKPLAPTVKSALMLAATKGKGAAA